MNKKRKSEENSKTVLKKRKILSMEIKLDVIKRIDSGEKQIDVARVHDLSPTTISTILKSRDRILDHIKNSINTRSPIISKRRGRIMEDMEHMLHLWIEDLNQRGIPRTKIMIAEKSKRLYEYLRETGKYSDVPAFGASNGWFDKFKKRYNYHNIKLTGEASSADVDAAKEYLLILKNIINEGGYRREQIFNVDETGLYWKKLPDRTYISKAEKIAPGYKASKERITLLLGGNSSGDFKIKPLIINRFENPRAFKINRVSIENLPVVWRANRKAWVTQEIFEDWFVNCFIPDVKKYCKEKDIPFKILLLIDNAPGHGTERGLNLSQYDPNVTVAYLPKNTTSILQPMDQGVIAAFKKLYLRCTFKQIVKSIDCESKPSIEEFWRNKFDIYEALKNVDSAWKEISQSTMASVWKNVCPYFFDSDNSDISSVNEEALLEEIVELGNELKMNIHSSDVEDLIQSCEKELSDEELLELNRQEDAADVKEEAISKKFTAKGLEEAFRLMDQSLTILRDQDADDERFLNVQRSIHESLACYSVVLHEKIQSKLQPPITQFLQK